MEKQVGNLTIIEQGRVRVCGMSIIHDSPRVALVEIDLHTKYADIFSYGVNNEGFIDIFYEETEHSLHLKEDVEPGSLTIVRLEDYKGWEVWNMIHNRYLTTITLIK